MLSPLGLLIQDEGHEGLDSTKQKLLETDVDAIIYIPADGGEGKVDHHEEEKERPKLRNVHIKSGLGNSDKCKSGRLLKHKGLGRILLVMKFSLNLFDSLRRYLELLTVTTVLKSAPLARFPRMAKTTRPANTEVRELQTPTMMASRAQLLWNWL